MIPVKKIMRTMVSCSGMCTLFFFLVLVYSTVNPSLAKVNLRNVASDRVKKICNATEQWNQPRCYQFYNSDPRSRTADYKELVDITIDLANSECRKLMHWLVSSAKNETDHSNRRRYLRCSKHYKEALEKLDAGKKFLEMKKYERVKDEAADAIEDSNECLADFAGLSEPYELSKAAKDFEFITTFVHPALELLPTKGSGSKETTNKPYYFTLQFILEKWVIGP